MLIANHLQLEVPGFALRATEIGLRAGDAVWLQGTNGAGKSMLLRSLAGIFNARSARQCIGIHALSEDPVAYKREVVYAGNAKRAYGHLSVQRALDFASQFYPAWRAQRVTELAKTLSLSLDAKVATLSQGMTAKLNFLLAIGSGARVLLIDELLAPVDADSREHMAFELAKELQQGAALVYCSHAPDEVTPLLKQQWQMRAGTLFN